MAMSTMFQHEDVYAVAPRPGICFLVGRTLSKEELQMAQNGWLEGCPGEVLSRIGTTAMAPTMARSRAKASILSGAPVPMARALTLAARGAAEEIDMAMVSLVVMEPGSEWPRHVGHHSNLVAFSHKGEKLLQRTREELDALRRSRQNVRVAVLACNGETSGEADSCRAQIARTLLAAVMGTTFGHLVLSAGGSAALRVRQELIALAGTLSEQLRGTSATVSLRFTEASYG
jgi:hypothetical protein